MDIIDNDKSSNVGVRRRVCITIPGPTRFAHCKEVHSVSIVYCFKLTYEGVVANLDIENHRFFHRVSQNQITGFFHRVSQNQYTKSIFIEYHRFFTYSLKITEFHENHRLKLIFID